MMNPDPHGSPTEVKLAALAADPSQRGDPEEVLAGDAEAADGHAVLRAAGVDVDALIAFNEAYRAHMLDVGEDPSAGSLGG